MKAIKLFLVSLFALIPFQSAYAAAPKTYDNYVPMDEGIEDHWAYEEMDDLINADIVDGFMDKDNDMYVKPENNITRAEFVKLIVTALDLKESGNSQTFTDVKKGDWFYGPVQIASSLGIVNGKSATKFAPNDKINRQEMTKIIVEAFKNTIVFPETGSKTFADITDNWAKDYIKKASAAELVNGTGGNKFSPKANATRAQAMVIIHRALQKEQSNVAADEEILPFLKNHILKENEMSEANNSEGLIKLYEENGTGYYRVLGTEIGGVEFPVEEGEEYTITIDDEKLALKVLEKSNRFATVEVTGMKVTVKYTSKDMNMDFTEDMDGAYQLKKDSVTGAWKIYNYYPYFSEDEL